MDASLDFGCIPKSSTTHALLSMVHSWTKIVTELHGSTIRIVLSSLYVCMVIKHIIVLFVETPRIRIVLFDYKKAFDLIDLVI